jgi:hypothetical protein
VAAFIGGVRAPAPPLSRASRPPPFFRPQSVAAFPFGPFFSNQTILTAAKSCSTASDLAKNFVPSIDNDAPAKGATVKTTFAFDLDAPITGGTAYYSATLNGLGPYTSQEALCDATAKSNDPCPLGVGAHNQVSSTQNTLSGKIVTTVEWYDDAGARILCAELTTKNA